MIGEPEVFESQSFSVFLSHILLDTLIHLSAFIELYWL